MSGLPAMVNRDGIKKRTQVKFGGYDHREGAGDGTLWDMENLCGDRYPLLSVRPRRVEEGTVSSPQGIYAHNGLYWAADNGLYREGVRLGGLTDGEKRFVSLGAYVLVFPDKAYYNTLTQEFGNLEAEWAGEADFQDGTYNDQPAERNSIVSKGEPFPFKVGDGVTISGCEKGENNKTAVVEEVSDDKKTLRFLENCFTNVKGQTLTLRREVPNMDFVCANENRIWGCKGDTIYASKLGDPFNWNVMQGISTDSYAVNVGSAGDFTACCSYLGYAVFFKEEHIYKVYGSKPANFQVMASASQGVEKGSHKSLAIAGERLLYLSRSGVMRYSGGTPELASQAFGLSTYHNGVGGSDGIKYYLSLMGEGGESHLFVLDTRTGMWHREDSIRVVGFAFENGLHLLDEAGKLWRVKGEAGEGEVLESPFQSFAEFGDFTEYVSSGIYNPDKKGLSTFQLRAELSPGASLTVKVKFDGEEDWRELKTLTADRKKSFVIPIIPRRCDHWRLRLEGQGEWKLLSLSREFYEGSEV